MKDIYVMDKNTGEIIPSETAIHIFYTIEKHGCLEDWTDNYEITNLETKTEISLPDFKQVLA